jgi:hypothetical protein
MYGRKSSSDQKRTTADISHVDCLQLHASVYFACRLSAATRVC